MTYVPYDWRKDPHMVCPFGERDLSTNVCYSGSGQNRCPFFVKYDWVSEASPSVWCMHSTPKLSEQPELEF